MEGEESFGDLGSEFGVEGGCRSKLVRREEIGLGEYEGKMGR